MNLNEEKPRTTEVRFAGLLASFLKGESSISEKVRKDAAEDAATNAAAKASSSGDGGHGKTVLKRSAMYNDRNSTKSVVGSSK